MALFKVEDIQQHVPITDDEIPEMGSHTVAGEVRHILGQTGKAVVHALPTLVPDCTQYLPTRGKWSLHQMIQHISALVGPSEVIVVTWGLTENPLRQVLNLVDARLITKLDFLIDRRTKVNSPDAHQLLMATAGAIPDRVRVRATHTHAKMVVWNNATQPVLLVTSANLTENQRFEMYVVDTHASAAQWMHSVLALELQGDQPFHGDD